MDFTRFLGCFISIFSLIIVLYWVLYYYPIPFYYDKNYSIDKETGNVFPSGARRYYGKKIRIGSRQGKMPVAERLHKVQKERILGKKPSFDERSHDDDKPFVQTQKEPKELEDRRPSIHSRKEPEELQYRWRDESKYEIPTPQSTTERLDRLDAEHWDKLFDNILSRAEHKPNRLKQFEGRRRGQGEPKLMNKVQNAEFLSETQNLNQLDAEHWDKLSDVVLTGERQTPVRLFGVRPSAEEFVNKENRQRGQGDHTPRANVVDAESVSKTHRQDSDHWERLSDDMLAEGDQKPGSYQTGKPKSPTELIDSNRLDLDIDPKDMIEKQKERLRANEWKNMRERLMVFRNNRLQSAQERHSTKSLKYTKRHTTFETPVLEEQFNEPVHMLGR